MQVLEASRPYIPTMVIFLYFMTSSIKPLVTLHTLHGQGGMAADAADGVSCPQLSFWGNAAECHLDATLHGHNYIFWGFGNTPAHIF